jgi:hypothetical protein
VTLAPQGSGWTCQGTMCRASNPSHACFCRRCGNASREGREFSGESRQRVASLAVSLRPPTADLRPTAIYPLPPTSYPRTN